MGIDSRLLPALQTLNDMFFTRYKQASANAPLSVAWATLFSFMKLKKFRKAVPFPSVAQIASSGLRLRNDEVAGG